MKQFLKKYGHAWTLLYIFIYMPWFMYLEKNVVTYTSMHTALDDKIPFCEYFIVPYLLWFLFIPAVFIFLFFTSKEEYYKLSAFLFIGMTICLTICTIWPNGQELRQNFQADKNIFTHIVAFIYHTDTNTNVFPSIHVFNSVGACIAVCKSKTIHKKSVIRPCTVVLTILICLSTVFLKQHSVLDVIGGIVLACVMYTFVYLLDYRAIRRSIEEKKLAKNY